MMYHYDGEAYTTRPEIEGEGDTREYIIMVTYIDGSRYNYSAKEATYVKSRLYMGELYLTPQTTKSWSVDRGWLSLSGDRQTNINLADVRSWEVTRV